MAKLRQQWSDEVTAELAEADAASSAADAATNAEGSEADVPGENTPVPPPFRVPDWLRTEMTDRE
ncbi:hypothetical protein SCUP234_13444, partial [Seiridium cupressi]